MILIGKRIKRLRNKYKYTQTELAEKVGVTKSTIAAYENDSRLPSYEVLIRMAGVFKVSIDSLLLNRTEVIIDAHGLTTEQIELLSNIIGHFRKCNIVEELFSDMTPEMRDRAKSHYEFETYT